ncbi:hypothetical protein ACFW0P_12180 [Lysobacter soli]|uniref:hypothetical protein n=1 Tax=Lysobacter soli TaxID=453783 RepID=UPI00369D2A27
MGTPTAANHLVVIPAEAGIHFAFLRLVAKQQRSAVWQRPFTVEASLPLTPTPLPMGEGLKAVAPAVAFALLLLCFCFAFALLLLLLLLLQLILISDLKRAEHRSQRGGEESPTV